jgi:hypothetical protein
MPGTPSASGAFCPDAPSGGSGKRGEGPLKADVFKGGSRTEKRFPSLKKAFIGPLVFWSCGEFWLASVHKSVISEWSFQRSAFS